MNHIAAAEQAVTNRYGPAYAHIAACAAVAARTATVDEYDAEFRKVADLIRDALYELEAGTPRGVAAAEAMLNSLVKEIES